MTSTHSTAPAALAAIPLEQVVELDVREDLLNGREPFGRIMAARQTVPPGGALRLRAIFEPVPLYAVMAQQGFDHWTEELAPDDWQVSFYPARSGAEARPARSTSAERGALAASAGDPGAVTVLDLRDVAASERMPRAHAALDQLPAGRTLLLIDDDVPQIPLSRLEELGFTREVREQKDGPVRVFIRRGS